MVTISFGQVRERKIDRSTTIESPAHWGTPAWFQLAAVVLIVVGLHIPLGDYIAKVYTTPGDWRIERLMYRCVGVQSGSEQSWTQYLRSLLAFSAVGVLFLYGLLLLQTHLPEPWGHSGMTPALAFHTAVSFTTNTSWQNYAGESTLGHVGLAAGLGVQAYASAAVGMCAAIALVRGISRSRTFGVGNFWVDLVRTIVRILLPLSVVVAVMLIALGVVQNFVGPQALPTLAGGVQNLPGGPVGSWESIKLLSGDGGGAFNVNSAHPFENPTPVSNVVEIVAMLLLPLAMVRAFGVLVCDKRQGRALLTVVAVLFAVGMAAIAVAQAGTHGTVPVAVGGATEGTEMRFGIPGSAMFGQAATASADGAANASYDSFASLGGGMMLVNMMVGEVSPGGAGSGLYGLVMMVLLAVFLGGLMIGKTPEYLTKRLNAREMKFVGLYILVAPVTILVGCAVAIALPQGRRAMLNAGPHGLSEVLYAFTSSVAGNGSAFAGFTGNTQWFNALLGFVMLIGRYLPIIVVLALAGSFAAQRTGVVNAGTLRTHSPVFVGLVVGVTLIMVGLEYFPALALGPLADGFG